MRIPTGYTETQVLEIIARVSKRYKKYKFSYYTEEDIEQECFILAVDALDRYESGPLENFLAAHIRNRLLNARRKNGQDYNGEMSNKYYVCNPISINIISNDETNIRLESGLLQQILSKELMEYIDNNLDVSLRMDYLKFKEGIKLHKLRKEKVKAALIEILEKYYVR